MRYGATYTENALAQAVDTCGASRSEREALYALVLDERFGPRSLVDVDVARAAVSRALEGIRRNMTGVQRAEARVLAAVYRSDAEDFGLSARMMAGHSPEIAATWARKAARAAEAYMAICERL